VLDRGEPVVYLERGGKRLVTFPAVAGSTTWAEALAGLVKNGRLRSLDLATIDGGPSSGSPLVEALLAAGFAPGYRGLVLRG